MSEINATFSDNFDIATQKKILSLFIYDKSWAELNGMNVICSEFFTNRILKNICSWFHSYYARYKTFPTQLVLTNLAQEYINNNGLDIQEYYEYEKCIKELFKIDLNDDFKYFRDQAIAFAKQAAWKKALSKGSHIIASNNNVSVALEEFRKVLTLGEEVDMGLDYETLDIDTFLDLLRDSYDPSSMIKTGIASWDEALGGGFVKRNIHLIGAPPGAGKSRTLAYLATQALKNYKRVVFITMELSEIEVMSNIMGAISGFGLHQQMENMNYEALSKRNEDFKNNYKANLKVKFFNPGAINADNISNYIKGLICLKNSTFGENWKPDVIFIDYMDKMLPTQKLRGNSYEDMGGVATDCKNLAITFDCPVITASQLGRVVWNLKGNEVVGMDSVAESSAKTHLCHSLTTINVTPAERELRKSRLYVAKSRSGHPGKIIFCEHNLGICHLQEAAFPWKVEELDVSVGFAIKDNSKS